MDFFKTVLIVILLLVFGPPVLLVALFFALIVVGGSSRALSPPDERPVPVAPAPAVDGAALVRSFRANTFVERMDVIDGKAVPFVTSDFLDLPPENRESLIEPVHGMAVAAGFDGPLEIHAKKRGVGWTRVGQFNVEHGLSLQP